MKQGFQRGKTLKSIALTSQASNMQYKTQNTGLIESSIKH